MSDSEPVLTPARSDLTFVPDVAVAKIHFGSTRNAKRVEVALVAQNETQDTTGGTDALAGSSPTLLPDAFWLRAETRGPDTAKRLAAGRRTIVGLARLTRRTDGIAAAARRTSNGLVRS